MVLLTIRLIQYIFETNKLIISLLLLMCKHVSMLQIAQQDPKVQKRKKKDFFFKHTRKRKNARYTKHHVHFGINHAISILIGTLIDIIFVILKNDRGILDYNKMQPRPKMFCFSSSRYLCLIYSL